MGQLTWLPGVLEGAGLDVYVMPGAETRTTISSSGVPRTMPDLPPAVIWHHTATSTVWADGHVAALLRDGRRDLPGPLVQLGVERDGTIVVVALGRANHNGASSAKYGNDAIGLEFYNAGDGVDPWPAVQLEAGQRAIAAILRHLGLGVDRCIGHKESDPTRKVDPRPLDMNRMRARIARHMTAHDQEAPDLDANQARQLDDVHNWLAAVVGIQQDNAGDSSSRRGWNFERFDRSGRTDPDEPPRPAWQRWMIEATRGVRVLLARDAVDAELDVGAAAVQIADLLDDELAVAVADELDRRARERLEVAGS